MHVTESLSELGGWRGGGIAKRWGLIFAKEYLLKRFLGVGRLGDRRDEELSV